MVPGFICLETQNEMLYVRPESIYMIFDYEEKDENIVVLKGDGRIKSESVKNTIADISAQLKKHYEYFGQTKKPNPLSGCTL